MEYKLFRIDKVTKKCVDCGLMDGHSNACHDAAPARMIEKLLGEKRELESGILRLTTAIGPYMDVESSIRFANRTRKEWVEALRLLAEVYDKAPRAGGSSGYLDVLDEIWELIKKPCCEGFGTHGDAHSVGCARAQKEEKGVFCLDHRRVMQDGVCPKCGTEKRG